MPRLFTGLAIPGTVTEQLAHWCGGLSYGKLPGMRWTETADYHLTLCYIGDIDTHMANDIALALETVHLPPVAVTLTSADVFGGNKPRALVVKATLTDGLTSLHARHETAVRSAGLLPESRKYTPHVTLARLRHVTPEIMAGILMACGHFRPVTFEARAFVLYSARDSAGGGPYRKEIIYPLSSAPPERARGCAD